MKGFILVFLGGGTGTLARYALVKLYGNQAPAFPFATLTANFLSCLLFGMVIGAFTLKGEHNDFKLLALTGFCGGFSTFSAFAYESNQLITGGNTLMAILNIILNFALSLSALYVGGWLIKAIL